MYKIKHELSESCLKTLLTAVNGNYNLRSDSRVPDINTVFYGASSIRYFGPMTNSLLPALRKICNT